MPVTVDVDNLSVRDPASVLAFGAVGTGLEKRAPRTNATCVASYRWLDNSLQQTPCLVAAYAMGACRNGDWKVPAIPENMGYAAPKFNYTPLDTPVNVCTCSWAVYNLVSGCAVCQERADGYLTWSAYILECTEQFRSDDTYYPESIIFPSGSKIPYWASYNPMVLESTPMRPEKSPSSTHQQFTSQGISSPSVPVAHNRNFSGDTQDSNDTRFLATGYGSIDTATAGPSGSSGFPQDHAPAYHHQPHFTTDGFSSAGGAHPPFSDDGATDIAGSSILGSGVADDMLEGIVDMHDGDSHYGDGPGGERWFASRSPVRTVAGTVATGLSGYFLAPGSTSVGGLGRQGAEGMRPTPMPRVGGGGIRLANPDGDI